MSLLAGCTDLPCETPILGPVADAGSTAWTALDQRAESPSGVRVVHLEGLRPRRVARQPEEPDHPLAPQLPARPDGVVVEATGQLHAPAGGIELVQHVRPARLRPDLGDVVGVQGGHEGRRQVGLGEGAVIGLEVARRVRAWWADEARTRLAAGSSSCGRRELEADRRPAQQLGVEGQAARCRCAGAGGRGGPAVMLR